MNEQQTIVAEGIADAVRDALTYAFENELALTTSPGRSVHARTTGPRLSSTYVDASIPVYVWFCGQVSGVRDRRTCEVERRWRSSSRRHMRSSIPHG